MTLYGVGELTFGDDLQILPHCTSTFSLEQSYETWGYNYLSSTKKMLVPAIDSFHAKTKQWTINLSAPVLTENLRLKLYNTDIINNSVTLDKLTQFIGRPNDIVLPSSNTAVMPLAFDLETNSEVLVSYNNLTGELTFPPNYNNLTKIYFNEPFEGPDGSYMDSSNHIFSFSGILYHHGENLFIKANEVQISKYPDYSLQNPIIQLSVLKELKLYKI